MLWFRWITRVTLPAASGIAGSFVSQLRWIAPSRAYLVDPYPSFCSLQIFPPFSLDNSPFRLSRCFISLLRLFASSSLFLSLSFSRIFLSAWLYSRREWLAYPSQLDSRLVYITANQRQKCGSLLVPRERDRSVLADEMQIRRGKRYRSSNRKINMPRLKFPMVQIKRNF